MLDSVVEVRNGNEYNEEAESLSFGDGGSGDKKGSDDDDSDWLYDNESDSDNSGDDEDSVGAFSGGSVKSNGSFKSNHSLDAVHRLLMAASSTRQNNQQMPENLEEKCRQIGIQGTKNSKDKRNPHKGTRSKRTPENYFAISVRVVATEDGDPILSVDNRCILAATLDNEGGINIAENTTWVRVDHAKGTMKCIKKCKIDLKVLPATMGESYKFPTMRRFGHGKAVEPWMMVTLVATDHDDFISRVECAFEDDTEGLLDDALRTKTDFHDHNTRYLVTDSSGSLVEKYDKNGLLNRSGVLLSIHDLKPSNQHCPVESGGDGWDKPKQAKHCRAFNCEYNGTSLRFVFYPAAGRNVLVQEFNEVVHGDWESIDKGWSNPTYGAIPAGTIDGWLEEAKERKSKTKGYSYCKGRGNPWRVSKYYLNKSRIFGSYKTEEEAKRAAGILFELDGKMKPKNEKELARFTKIALEAIGT